MWIGENLEQQLLDMNLLLHSAHFKYYQELRLYWGFFLTYATGVASADLFNKSNKLN